MKTKNKFGKSIMSQMTITLFLSLLLALLLIILLLFYFIRIEGWKVLPPDETINVKVSPFTRMIIFLLIVFIISAVVSINLGRRFVKPISELKNMTSEVAKGNFEVKIKDEDIPNNEVGEFMENFNTMVDELKKNEILKTDFISNVSHEFKTPLAVIQGYATLLQDDNITEEERIKYSQFIFEGTQNLTTLVNDILKISKIDNRKITIDNCSFKLDEQIRECILSLEEYWNNKNLELDINLDEISIVADKNLLNNVWNNLINNAIKYSSENSKIIINLKEENSFAIFSIKDFGCGISKDDMPYIFDKFYQADKSHASKGNGLGLALTKKIVLLSKGTIEVHSTINEGSEFIVKLPISKT